MPPLVTTDHLHTIATTDAFLCCRRQSRALPLSLSYVSSPHPQPLLPQMPRMAITSLPASSPHCRHCLLSPLCCFLSLHGPRRMSSLTTHARPPPVCCRYPTASG
ncbi:hypothetical protein Nepgr_021794 [Nepenthes gracilis]|uniref:Uncharacterized protein n=1 Tax=Nepenthes gracilis TaxID=150966 RepID=A0AAD3SXF1_NEPGR|nr:hypothetical protein Nepgr_021794 [Nepenthes gracilis]